MSEIGHNSVDGAARAQLRNIVERIERLEEEKKAIAEDIRGIYTEAKANGFDTKALREVVKLRKQDPDAIDDFRAQVDLYMSAFGMSKDEAIKATGVLD